MTWHNVDIITPAGPDGVRSGYIARFVRNESGGYGFQVYNRETHQPVGSIQGPYGSVAEAIEAARAWKLPGS